MIIEFSCWKKNECIFLPDYSLCCQLSAGALNFATITEQNRTEVYAYSSLSYNNLKLSLTEIKSSYNGDIVFPMLNNKILCI
jgi:hypothetical protein